jgi:hypothetical protein
MEEYMKTFVKIAHIALLVLLALTLVTCEDFLAGLNPKEEAEYTDWEYVDLPDGTSELTLYLDGTRVPVTEKTGKPKQSRALNLQLAKMSHDYFEVVFWNRDNGTTPITVARATWELGQAAGISGVYRAGDGVDYTPITPDTGPACSIIFVGRKQTMTLLGVGVMTHINKTVISGGKKLTTSDRSVTFTVSPLISKIAIDELTNLAPAPSSTDPIVYDSSFLTAANGGVGAAPTTTLYGIDNVIYTNTIGRLTPLGGATYPLFMLPDYETHRGGDAGSGPLPASGTDAGSIVPALTAYKTVGATYTIRGLTIAAQPGNTATDLTSAVRLYAAPEVIKREPRYISGGQTWYAIAQIDFGGTGVDITPASAYAPATLVGTFSEGDPVDATLPITFYITPASNGIFSIVFSIPVYALTLSPVSPNGGPTDPIYTLASTNGGPPAEIWHITPGYGQSLYNLDNGTDAGGCVLLGVNVSSLDWLEIFTTGIGFKN